MTGKLLRLCCLTCFLLITPFVFAQNNYPQNYFINPLKSYYGFSGTFAELRPNHFHSGMDFRTNGTIGLPVYSAADGYVSRIKVSSIGGGKILYINHPNGYKSVYMHLDDFFGDIEKIVKTYQYKNQVFEFDINIDSTQLPVKQGQQVAYSGNTGGSGGPHLHFELRHINNDKTVHPFLFGYTFCDIQPPTLNEVRIYPANNSSTINGKSNVYTLNTLPTVKKVGKKTVKKEPTTDTLQVCGDFYFGISAFDELCNSVGKKGIYKMEIFIDKQRVYAHCIKEFLFEDTRYINAITDYSLYLKTRKQVFISKQPDYIAIPEMYEEVKDKGVYKLTDGELHEVMFQVSDFVGNQKQHTVFLQSSKPASTQSLVADNKTTSTKNRFDYTKANSFKSNSFYIEMEPYTLYNSIDFEQSVQQSISAKRNPWCFNIHKQDVPVHKSYKLGIPVDFVPEFFRKKIVIVQVDSPTSVSALKTTQEAGYLVAFPRSLGTFSTAIDTTAPTIELLNLKENDKIKQTLSGFSCKITDALSGIDTYNCYLNNEWTLAEYDKKTNKISIDVKNKLQSGTNTLKVIVEDACGNKTEKAITFSTIP